MEGSVGSEPIKESRSVFLSPAYSYFIWFLIGCMAHFGLQLFVLSCSIFTDVLEVSSNYCGSFLANMVALSIISCYLGFIISHVLFPLKKVTIEFSFIIASLSLVLLCLVNVVDKKIGRVIYILSMFVGCFCFGVMESVGITTASDPGLQGRPPKRVVFFLCGHPIGYTLALLIHLLIENSYFSFYINSCGYTGAIYSCYGIFVLLLLGVPVIIFVIMYLYPMKSKKHIWQDSNIINSTIFYAEALRLLRKYTHYIVILVVIEATEVILNWRIVLFLHDPYPKFDSIVCSLSIVMGYAIFDFVGRGFSIGVRRMVSDLKDRNRVMVNISKTEETKKEEKNPDEMEKGLEDQLDQDPELRNKFRLRLYKNFLPFTWLPITFRIITGTVIFMQRHHPESLALANYTNLQGTIMLTMINAFIRGMIVSYVYSNLFEASKADYLKEHNVTVHPQKDEAKGCIDMRYNANVTGSIMVSIVRMIDLSVMLVLIYIFYKYNRLLFDVSEVYTERKVWATDHLSSDFCKFFWWVRSILYLIWRDMRSPFDLK
ncbi:hypothetical protein MACJ_002965 [Theileria orientalis]|uniref:Uncharacterized protein n=1 Tax=Theileria orientalis TaxID=68886 RepID=A0A976M6V1_THEOR|nr:hypothetical protein MACJ_002965 [Theileria orientalis]